MQPAGQELEISGKIAAVLWTRRDDQFTLQIMRREELGQKRAASRSVPDSTSARFAGDVQIWLLRADGAIVSPTKRLESPEMASCIAVASGQKPCLGYEILYAYSISAGTGAVAVAMRLGDSFMLEKLPPLS